MLCLDADLYADDPIEADLAALEQWLDSLPEIDLLTLRHRNRVTVQEHNYPRVFLRAVAAVTLNPIQEKIRDPT
jgi:hypothetical protein